MDEPARLAVDLGTTHTVAVVRRAEQPPRTLLFDGSPLLPGGVYVGADGVPHTGRDAHRLGTVDPQCFEPHPKRRVDDGTVLLGAHDVPVERLLAAVLRRVADEARVAGVDPTAATVLTCPADWGQPRRDRLRAAARLAGLGDVHLLDEPIAAATYCVEVLGQRLAPGGHLGVFDFGGGTLDVAVVRGEPAGPRVLATGGLDDLGGLDIDEALAAHLGQLVQARDPGLWQRLRNPRGTADRRDRQALWAEVRAAKEMLSRTTSAPVQVPGRDDPMHLTREELDRVAGPLVARAVDETRRVLQRAGVDPATLAGLLLVGGSSRLPLVATRLHARLGIAASVPEQPELPVAFGALRHQPATTTPPPPTTSSAYPPSAPGFATPTAPTSPYPVSGGFPVPATAPTGPRRPAPVAARRRRPARRALTIVTVLAVAAACAGAVTAGIPKLANVWDDVTGGGALTGDNVDNVGTLTTARTSDPARPGTAGATIAGDHVVSAVAGGGSTQVVSLPAGQGAPQWQVSVPIEPAELRLTTIGDLIVIDGDSSTTDAGKNVRAVLAATDGRLLWKNTWEQRRDLGYYGTDALVEARGPSDDLAILRVDLRTGKSRWRRAGNPDVLTSDARRAEPMLAWPATTTPPPNTGTPPGVRGSLRDTLTATGTGIELDTNDQKAYVFDARTGKTTASGPLPIDESRWTAYDGLVIGKQAPPGADTLAGYAVPGFTRAWSLRMDAGRRISRVKPCGPHLVCVALDGSTDHDETIAVDTRTGQRAWSATVDWSDDETWYATQSALVFGRAPFDTIEQGRILGWDGKPRRQLPEGSSVLAVGDGRIVVQCYDGPSRQWRLWVEDITTARATKPVAVGADEPPSQVTLTGDRVAIVTADRRTMMFTVGGLT